MDSQEVARRAYILIILCLISLEYGTKPGTWQWYNLQSLFDFTVLLVCVIFLYSLSQADLC